MTTLRKYTKRGMTWGAGIALIAALTWSGRRNDPTPQELMRAHAFKPRNDFTADNARTQRAINALLMGAK